MNFGASNRIIKIYHQVKKSPGISRERALLVLFGSLSNSGADWTALNKINTHSLLGLRLVRDVDIK